MYHQAHATTVHFAHTPYQCVALHLTLSRTYCTVHLLTVHTVFCAKNDLHQQRALISDLFSQSKISVSQSPASQYGGPIFMTICST